MASTVLNPTNARKQFYQLLREVNENHTEVEIVSEKGDNNAVLISRKDWDSIKETLFLEQTGTLDTVRQREEDKTGVTNIDDLDWDNL